MALPSNWQATTPPLGSANQRLLQWLNDTVEGIGGVFEVLRRTPSNGALADGGGGTINLVAATPVVIPITSSIYQNGFEVQPASDDIEVLEQQLAVMDVRLSLSNVGVNGTITLNARNNGTNIGAGLTIPTSNQTPGISASAITAGLAAPGDVLDFTLTSSFSQLANVDVFQVQIDGRPI